MQGKGSHSHDGRRIPVGHRNAHEGKDTAASESKNDDDANALRRRGTGAPETAVQEGDATRRACASYYSDRAGTAGSSPVRPVATTLSSLEGAFSSWEASGEKQTGETQRLSGTRAQLCAKHGADNPRSSPPVEKRFLAADYADFRGLGPACGAFVRVRSDLIEHGTELVEIDRLGQMKIKPGLFPAPHIFFGSETGQGDASD